MQGAQATLVPAVGADADHLARAVLEVDGRSVERVHLLGCDAVVLGAPRSDGHLCTQGVLALTDAIGDVPGQLLGAQGNLAQDDLADDLVDGLLEAGHVRALLLGAQVDEAVEAGRVQPGAPGAGRADPNHFLDPVDPHQR